MSMFIGQGLSLGARHAAQVEKRVANTATVAASAAAAAAAASTAAAAATEWAFVRVFTIIRSLPTCQNGFHCLSANRRIRR